MKRGLVRISLELIQGSLRLPVGWMIESLEMRPGERDVRAIIAGSDFPEDQDGKPRECFVTVHAAELRFEVREAESPGTPPRNGPVTKSATFPHARGRG
jgi:hypothetical protein